MFDIEAFKAEAAQWANDAKQCKCCQAWALLNELGHCAQCRIDGHKHPEFTIILEK